MNDLISLICPSCGGKLSIEKNTPTYICDYCGQTHKLREQDIESFGRCPICHRNDRIEKLTAIRNNHDQLAMKFRPPENLKAVKFYRLRDSTKPTKSTEWINPDELQESIYTKRSKLFAIGIIIAFLALIVINSNEGSGFFINLLKIVMILGFFPLVIIALINLYKAKSDYINYYKQLNIQKSIQLRRLTKRYDKIYYCLRDDLLFIPGEDGSAPGDNYEGFLTMELDKKGND